MTPEADRILKVSAGQLMAGVIPLLPNAYSQGSTALLAFLMLFAAEEYERGADIRATDNAEMRAAFGAVTPLVGDTKLKAKLDEAAASADASLLISALDKSNAHLRALLIELQIYLEEQPGDDARTGEKRIWTVLQASAARRLLKSPLG
ncbi:MAG: hypothetical protein ABSA49_08180 [Rhizomicrobium sp.]|jgi:hypothetical protein